VKVGVLQAFKRKYRSVGLTESIALVFRRLYSAAFHPRNMLFGIDLSEILPSMGPSFVDTQVVEKRSFNALTGKELEALMAYGGPMLLTSFKKNFTQGYRLFIAYRDGEVAGAHWVLTGGSKKFYVIPLLDRDFMFMYVFVIDKFRKKGVCLVLYSKTLEAMKADGYRRGYVFTKEWNFHQKTCMKVGFQLIGKFTTLHIFAKPMIVWSSIAEQKFF